MAISGGDLASLIADHVTFGIELAMFGAHLATTIAGLGSFGAERAAPIAK